jgi:plastocyanin
MLPLLVALVLTAAACGGYGGSSSSNSSSESQGGTTTVAGQSVNDHGTKDVAGKSSADLELYDFYFEPTVLKGTPGQTIKLELDNKGSVEHNFTITGQVDQNVASGKKVEVDMTFPKSGTLSFFCKFHQSQGMAGGLTVSGGAGSGGGGGTTGYTSTGY